MRVTTSLTYDRLQQNINTSLSNLNSVQTEISTGKKLTDFSDDPAGASESLTLHSSLADNAQYQRDAISAKSYLSSADTALTSATNIVRVARQIAVQGANGVQSSDSYTALSDQVNGLINQLTQIANTDLGGTYVFGGTQTKTAPFDATQTYQGNAQPLNATIGPGYTIQTSSAGSDVFGAAFTALKSLSQHLSDAAAGTAGAPANISNDIAGVASGLTAISTGQAIVGARINEVDSVTQRLSESQQQYQDSISNIEDVDLATAYVQLQSATNVYQASLATTSKAFQYSLADYLH
jgi:flagellar hook-associated protein 3 FlgL